jgi:hypothetical protein
MTRKKRMPIPTTFAARVLFEADRTCCVCRGHTHVQIHHIDDDPSNNDFENLAVLCFDCHRDTQIRGGFDRKLDAEQIKLYRRAWLEHVRNTRSEYNETPQRAPKDALEFRLFAVRMEIAKDRQDWLKVARLYDSIGEIELRDKYVERGLAEEPSPFYQILLHRVRSTKLELEDSIVEAALVEAADDWTTRAAILLDVGRTVEAAHELLDGVKESLNEGNWFSAAFYMRHGLNGLIVRTLFEMAIEKAKSEDNLWWQLRGFQELEWTDACRELLLGNASRIEKTGNLLLLSALASAKGDDDSMVEIEKKLEEGWPLSYAKEEDSEE